MFEMFKKKPATPAKPPVAAAPVAPAPEPDRSTLVPRIKTLEFKTAMAGMGIREDQLPYTEPLVADLLISYAFDLPGMFRMASSAAIGKLGLGTDEVRALAVANLRRQLPNIGFTENGPVKRIVTGENLEACVLLADKFWEGVAAETAGEVVVAVPSRDVVMYCSSESAEGVGVMREISAEVVKQETTHGLTERLLVWRGGRWAEY